jgi:hypothetical protein
MHIYMNLSYIIKTMYQETDMQNSSINLLVHGKIVGHTVK